MRKHELLLEIMEDVPVGPDLPGHSFIQIVFTHGDQRAVTNSASYADDKGKVWALGVTYEAVAEILNRRLFPHLMPKYVFPGDGTARLAPNNEQPPAIQDPYFNE